VLLGGDSVLQRARHRTRERWNEKVRRAGTTTYSQCGEDVISEFLLVHTLGLQRVRYLDIGAHDASHLSNTYRFYRQGHGGVSIEPDPVLFKAFKAKRVRDVCLNVGVGGSVQEVKPFYLMQPRSLSTFSKGLADRLAESPAYAIEKVIHVDIVPIADILESHWLDSFNYVSIDTEGFEIEILEGWAFDRFRPQAFCIETVDHGNDGIGVRRDDAKELMLSQGYEVYADTYVNTIFVDRFAWDQMKS
jgi:FkbM family methyltransferase